MGGTGPADRDATPVVAVCRSCGAARHQADRFCATCGSQLVSAVDSAKYKQVTVLFADVVRSMDIAATLDAERSREVITDLVEASASVIHRYGGTVEFTGDGVMALFGAPIALEDHAYRGCLAALAIQAEANRLAVEVQRRDKVALRMRVGLNSGRVIAGELGSGTLGYAATGTTVGFAQRMESVAPPGGVMLSESTAQLVERTVTLAEPEWVRIKGADEPVRARQLVAISPPDGQPRTRRTGAGRPAVGDGGTRRHRRSRERWTWRRRQHPGTAGHRKEPGRQGSRGAGRRPWCRGVLGLL